MLDTLPSDILYHVASWLSLSDILNMLSVNKRLAREIPSIHHEDTKLIVKLNTLPELRRFAQASKRMPLIHYEVITRVLDYDLVAVKCLSMNISIIGVLFLLPNSAYELTGSKLYAPTLDYATLLSRYKRMELTNCVIEDVSKFHTMVSGCKSLILNEVRIESNNTVELVKSNRLESLCIAVYNTPNTIISLDALPRLANLSILNSTMIIDCSYTSHLKSLYIDNGKLQSIEFINRCTCLETISIIAQSNKLLRSIKLPNTLRNVKLYFLQSENLDDMPYFKEYSGVLESLTLSTSSAIELPMHLSIERLTIRYSGRLLRIMNNVTELTVNSATINLKDIADMPRLRTLTLIDCSILQIVPIITNNELLTVNLIDCNGLANCCKIFNCANLLELTISNSYVNPYHEYIDCSDFNMPALKSLKLRNVARVINCRGLNVKCPKLVDLSIKGFHIIRYPPELL